MATVSGTFTWEDGVLKYKVDNNVIATFTGADATEANVSTFQSGITVTSDESTPPAYTFTINANVNLGTFGITKADSAGEATVTLAATTTTSDIAAGWTLDSPNLIYKTEGKNAGYSIADGTATYIDAVAQTSVVTIAAATGTTFDASNSATYTAKVTVGTGKKITLTNDAGIESVTIDATYTFTDLVDGTNKYAYDNNGTETVEVSGDTVTVKGNTKAGYSISGSTATYHAAVTNGTAPLATISGFASGAMAGNFSVTDQTVTVNYAAAMNGSNRTLSVTNSVDGYSATVALNSDLAPAISNGWETPTANDKLLVYGSKTSAGYTIADNVITFHSVVDPDEDAAIVKVKISSESSLTTDEISAIEALITVGTDKKVTLAAGLKDIATVESIEIASGYSFVTTDVGITATAQSIEFIGGGTATVKGDTSASYTVSGQTATYHPAVTDGTATLATIKGFKDTATVQDVGSNALIEIDNTTNTKINVLSNDILKSDYVVEVENTCSGYNPTLAVGSGVGPGSRDFWAVKDQTVIYGTGTSDGYQVNTNNQIVYVEQVIPATAKITVQLSAGYDTAHLDVDSFIAGFLLLDNSASPPTVTLNRVPEGVESVTIANDASYTFENNCQQPVLENATPSSYDSESGNLPLLATIKRAGYTIEGKVATVQNAGENIAFATISGLDESNAAANVSVVGDKIIISDKALKDDTNFKVALSTDFDYTLELGSDVNRDHTVKNEWRLTNADDGTVTATYTSFKPAYYSIPGSGDDAGKIIYVPEENTTTLATVTGLKASYFVADFDAVSEGVVVTTLLGDPVTVNNVSTIAIPLGALSDDANTKVAVSGTGYKLALGTDVPDDDTETPGWEEEAAGGAYTYKTTTPAYYSIPDSGSDTGKIIYTAATTETLVTVSGLANGLTINPDEIKPVEGTGNTCTITLTNDLLNNTAVTVTNGVNAGNKTYVLALKSGDNIPTEKDPYYTWSGSSGNYEYIYNKDAFYAVNANGGIDYTEYVTETRFTFSSTSLIKEDGNGKPAGITITSAAGTDDNEGKTVYTFTLTSDSVDTNLTDEDTLTITSANSESYVGKLVFDSSVTTSKPAQSRQWVQTPNPAYDAAGSEYISGSVNYKGSTEYYFEVDADGNYKYHPATETVLITVTGLTFDNINVARALITTMPIYGTKSVENEDGTTTEVSYISGYKVTINEGLLPEVEDATEDAAAGNAPVITISESGKNEDEDDLVNVLVISGQQRYTPTKNTTLEWTPKITKGTATYQLKETWYYDQTDNTYTFIPATSTDLAVISGLKTADVTAETYTSNISISNSVITISAGVLGNSTVSLTTGASDYKLALGEDVRTVSFDTTKGTNGLELDFSRLATTGLVHVKGHTTAGYALKDNGDIEYIPANTVDLATISGLDSTEAKNTTVTLANGKITIAKAALAGSVELVFDEAAAYYDKVKDYALNLIDADTTKTDVTPTQEWTLSGTTSKTATYQTKNSEYWTLDDATHITYHAPEVTSTLVTITGLGSNTELNEDNTKIGVKTWVADGSIGYKEDFVEGITVGEQEGTAAAPKQLTFVNIATFTDGTNGTATTTSVLGTTSLYLENGTDTKYKLVVPEEFVPKHKSTTDGYVAAQLAKESNATDATVTVVYTAGFTTNVDGTIATHTPEGAKTIATITGIKSTATVTGGAITGITITPTGATGSKPTTYTVKLDSDALTTTNGAVVSLTGATTDYNYTLQLDTGTNGKSVIAQAAAPAATHAWSDTGDSGSKTYTYKQSVAPYYKQVAENGVTTYTYTVTDDVTLATITGLKDLTPGSETDSNTLKSGSDVAVTYDSENSKIIINDKAANNDDITVSNTTLDVEISDTSSTKTFYGSSTAADAQKSYAWDVANPANSSYTYKETKPAYYDVVKDTATKTVTATYKVSASTTLATLTGLATGLTEGSGADSNKLKSSDGNDVAVTYDSTGDGKIILTDKAFKAANSDGKKDSIILSGSNYALDLGSLTPKANATSTQQWYASTTEGTYTYELRTGEYYEVATNTTDDTQTASYTKADTNTKITFTGLVSGLTIKADTDANKLSLFKDENAVATISGTEVTLYAAALPTTNNAQITFAGSGYSLKLDEAVTKATYTYAWNADSGYKYQKTLSAGYEVSGNTITYHNSASTPEDLAVLTCLKTGLTAADLKNGIKIENVYKDGALNYKLVLSQSVLDTGNVAFSGTHTGYTLGLGSGVKTTYDATDKEQRWYNDKANDVLILQNTPKPWYVLDADTVTYTKSSRDEDTTPLATLTGLKDSDNLTVFRDASGNSVFGKDGTAYVSVKDKVITLSQSALPDTAAIASPSVVSVTSGYTLALGADVTTLSTRNGDLTVAPGTTTADIKQNYTAGYLLTDGGTKIKGYSAIHDEVVATVSGLKSGAVTTDNVTLNGNIITIKKAALDFNGKTTVTVNNSDYTLELAEDAAPGTATTAWTVSDAGETTTAYFRKSSPEYFSKSGNTLVYNAKVDNATYITITGLADGLTDTQLAEGITFDDTNKKIVLKNSLLPGTNGDVTLKVSGDYANYRFSFAEDVTSLAEQDTTTGENKYEWVLSGTTATLKVPVKAGYAISADGKTITRSAVKTYNSGDDHSDERETLAVITGVTAITGLTLPNENGVITVDKRSLGSNTVSIAAKYGYKLALSTSTTDGKKVDTSSVASINKVTLATPAEGATTTTAYYKTYKPEYYTLNSAGTSITYTSEKATATLATIANVNKDVTEDAIKVNISDTAKTIKLDSTMLLEDASKKVTLSSTAYKLTLDTETAGKKVDIPSITNAKWTQAANSDSANLQAVYTKGFTLAKDGKSVSFSAAKALTDDVVIATIKGIAKPSNGAITDDDISGITVNNTDKTITIAKSKLDNKNVSISNNTLGYKILAYDDVATAVTYYDGWTVSGTTATFKTNNKNAYYTEDTKGNLIYIKPVAGTTAAVISGLKSGVGETATTHSFGIDGDNNSSIADTESGVTVEGTVIKLKQDVLPSNKDGAKVTLSNKGSTKYTLAFEGTVTTPDRIGSPSWTISGTTAKFNEHLQAGWTLTNDTTITYSEEKEANLLTTLTGLKKGVTSADITAGVQVSGNTITISDEVLGTSSVAIKNASGQSYKLALSGDVNTSSNNVEYKWYIKNGTATYRKVTSAYYTLNAAGTAITYKAEKLGDVLATVKGLSTDSNFKEFKDPYGNSVLGDGTNVWVSVDGDVITLKSGALTTSNVALTSGKIVDYTLKLDNVDKPTQTLTWTHNGTTATLTTNVTRAGYTLTEDGQSVIYSKVENNKLLLTLKGLKKATTATSNPAYISLEDNVVTLKAAALDNTNVTVSDKNYSLALADDVVQSTSAQSVWVTKGNTATYKVTSPEYFTYDSAKNTVVYHKALDNATMLTLSGTAFLNNTFKVDGTTVTDGTLYTSLDGIMVDTTNNKVVVSAGALKSDGQSGNDKIILKGTSTKDAEKDAYSSYKLELDADVTATALTGNKEWRQAKESTSATLVDEWTEGYKLSSDGKTINWAVGGNTTLYATLNGLNKYVKTDHDNNAETEKVYDKILYGKYRVLNEDNGILVDGNNNIILADAILDGTSKVTVKNVTGGDTYKVALNSDVDVDSTAKTVWEIKDAGSTTTAYIRTITPEYFTTDGTNVVRHVQKVNSTLATITGLKDSINATNGEITGISTYDSKDDDGNDITVIVLNENVLPATSKTVKITQGTGYILELGKASDGTTDLAAPTNTATGWTFKTNSNSKSATLSATSSEGYILSDDKKSILHKATVTTGTPIVTVSGLKKDLDTTDMATSFAGIATSDASKTSKTITLSKNMLGTSNVTVSDNTYKIELASDVITESEETDFWKITSNTSTSSAILMHGNSEYYTYDENKNTVIYNKATNEQQRVTIAGLKGSLSDDELAAGISLVDGSDDDGNAITYVHLNSSILPETQKNGASITLTLPRNATKKYKFSLEDDGANLVQLAEQDETTWTVAGTTATLTGHVPAGYTLNADGTRLTYSVEKTGKTAVVLATITGIDSSVNAKTVEDLLTLNTDFDNNIITLPNEVLGTANLTLKNGTGQTFKLDIANDVATEATDILGWVKSGANALYQSYKTDYYTLNNNKLGVTYVRPTAAKTWLTLTGLKSEFEVADGTIEGVTINDTEVTVSEAVLPNNKVNNAKVTLKGTNDTTKTFADGTIAYSTYKLALTESDNNSAKFGDTFTITPSGTKATYTKTLNEGYILSADGKTLTYTTPKTGQTLVTINGLKASTYTTDEISAYRTENSIASTVTDAQVKTQMQAAEWNEGISISEDGVITLSKDVLGSSDVTITQGKNPDGTATKYTLALDAEILTSKPSEWKETWTVSGTTATLKTYHDAYYALNAAGTTVKYYKPSDEKTMMTLKGLKNNLSIDDDGALTGVNIDGDTVTLDENALGTSNVSLTQGKDTSNKTTTYNLAISGVSESAVEDTEWVVSNGTAVYKTYNKEYYTLNKDKNGNGVSVTYVKPGNPTTTYVTITGLNKAITASDINVSGSNVITVNNNMLTTANLTLKNGNAKDPSGNAITYSFDTSGASDVLTDTPSATTAWSVSGTTATLRTYTPAYYKKDANGNVIYYKESGVTVLATITGLASNIDTSLLDTALAPGTAGTEGHKTITLTADMLGTSNVTLKNGTGQTFKLALDTNNANATKDVKVWDDVKAGNRDSGWTVTGTTTKTATYKKVTDAYYVLANGENPLTVTYKPKATSNIITISGLNSAVTATEGAIADTYLSYTAQSGDTYGNIELKAAALTNAAVKLVNGNDTDGSVVKNKLSLASTGIVTAKPDADDEWAVSGTTATYRNCIGEYYTIAETASNPNTVNYNGPSSIKNLFSISGLKSGVTAAQVAAAIDDIPETTVDDDEKLITFNTVSSGNEIVGTTNITFKAIDAAYKDYKLTGAGLVAPSDYNWSSDSKNVSYAAHTPGFEISADGKTATYYKEDARVKATIKVDRDNINLLKDASGADRTGVLTNAVEASAAGVTPVVEASPATFNLNKSILGTNKSVSINGDETYAFNFANDFHNAAIIGAATSDTITVAGTNLTVSGGNGNDSIKSSTAADATAHTTKNIFNGGAGNDTIEVTGSGDHLINGDAGTDTIIISGTGFNTVNGGADSDIIKILSGNSANTENLVYGGAGNDLITVSGGKGGTDKKDNMIYGDAGADNILVYGAGNNTIYGGADADVINISTDTAASGNNLIFGDAGNDTVNVNSATTGNTTVNGGAGDDVINIAGKATEIYGGDGNDTIKVTYSTASAEMTISGGKGNDNIDLGAVTAKFYYANGDGNDTITGYTKDKDTFNLTSGTISNAQLSGSDLVLTIGSGKVTLKSAGYAANSTFTYYNAAGTSLTTTVKAANASSGDLADDRFLASSADLIYDDANFATNDLTDLVNHSVDTHSINGLNPTQDLNDLDQSGLLTYGKDDKENK